MADDEFGEPGWEPTTDDFIRLAKERICQPTDPWGDPSQWPRGDHGHTDCFIYGGLINAVETLRAECERA